MTTRNFNYTGRMLIPQECIDARISKMGDGPPALEVEFDWDLSPKLESISKNASVFVDAFKDMSFMRFDYGTFGDYCLPEDVLLSELDSWSSADFVVRIVEDGNLLAASKKLTVTLALPDTKTRRSLIVPEFRDLGERPWMLEVHESITSPKLVFNEKWWNACRAEGFALHEDGVTMGTIMPSVLEGMLNWLLIHQVHDAHRWYDDPTWRGAWIRFARGLVDSPPPKPNQEGVYDDGPQEVSEWIRTVVSNYSEKKGLTSRMMSDIGGA